MPKQFTKDDWEQLDYVFDWTDWLEDGDYIVSSEVVVPEGLTWISTESGSDEVVVWLSGGEEGKQYEVDCKITTASVPPRKAKKTILLQIN